jgi:hypothetical protein
MSHIKCFVLSKLKLLNENWTIWGLNFFCIYVHCPWGLIKQEFMVALIFKFISIKNDAVFRRMNKD